jgi:hypothetical protein
LAPTRRHGQLHAVDLGHVEVAEDHVEARSGPNESQGLLPVARDDELVLPEDAAVDLDRELIVVDHEDAGPRHRHRWQVLVLREGNAIEGNPGSSTTRAISSADESTSSLALVELEDVVAHARQVVVRRLIVDGGGPARRRGPAPAKS